MYHIYQNKDQIVATFYDLIDAKIFCTDVGVFFDYNELDIKMPDGTWYDWEKDFSGN